MTKFIERYRNDEDYKKKHLDYVKTKQHTKLLNNVENLEDKINRLENQLRNIKDLKKL